MVSTDMFFPSSMSSCDFPSHWIPMCLEPVITFSSWHVPDPFIFFFQVLLPLKHLERRYQYIRSFVCSYAVACHYVFDGISHCRKLFCTPFTKQARRFSYFSDGLRQFVIIQKKSLQLSTTVLAMSSLRLSALLICSSMVFSISRSMYVQQFLWPILWIRERL